MRLTANERKEIRYFKLLIGSFLSKNIIGTEINRGNEFSVGDVYFGQSRIKGSLIEEIRCHCAKDRYLDLLSFLVLSLVYIFTFSSLASEQYKMYIF